MTLDPEKVPLEAGFEPRIYSSPGGRLNHKANEAVEWTRCKDVCCFVFL